MEFFTNPWVVGIGGGIIAGAVVAVVSRLLFSRRDSREHLQKVATANREVTYAIRPGISEGVVPSADVVAALLSATARRYQIDKGDLHSVTEIAEELTKEVMDSSFLSAKDKGEYCESLSNLARQASPEQGEAVSSAPRRTELAAYRARMLTAMSATLGVAAATMTVATTFLREGTFKGLPEGFEILLPALGSIAVGLTAAVLAVAFREAQRRTSRLRRSSEELERQSQQYHRGAHNQATAADAQDAAE